MSTTSTTTTTIPRLALACALTATLGLAACEDAHSHGEGELITRVELVVAPMAGGASTTFVADDADGDGGAPPTIDAVTLTAGTTYTATLRFLNALETPAEDITVEVGDEADEHQVFFTGTAITGGAIAHTYGDQDAGGLPLGLVGQLVAQAGAGDLTITLQHLPPINGAAVKVEGLADTARTEGLGALPGDTDASVTFPVTVQ